MIYVFGFIIILILSIIFSYSLIMPQMGKNAKGDRLKRMNNSIHFKDNIFQNSIVTTMDPPPFEAIKQMMKKVEDRVPSNPVKSYPIDSRRYNTDLSDVLITWMGHSTFLLRVNGITILTDPVFGKRASLSQFAGPQKFKYTNEFKIDDLPKIDVILISHDHYDHLDYKMIRKMRNKVGKFIAPLGVGAHLEHWGVDTSKIIELDWWEDEKIEGLQFTATPARHFTGRTITDRFKTLWCGWAIKSEKHSLYFSGDSGYFDGFKEIGEKLGPFDLSMMECGQYSEFWANIHMTPEESVQAAIDLKSKVALPMHWGKFKLSLHSWHEPPTRFTQKAEIEKLKVATPSIGATFTLDEIPQKHWWVN